MIRKQPMSNIDTTDLHTRTIIKCINNYTVKLSTKVIACYLKINNILKTILNIAAEYSTTTNNYCKCILNINTAQSN